MPQPSPAPVAPPRSAAAPYDLVVIGGGSGGVAAARRAAAHGARVALVEQGRLGGTCVNVGCVPKKLMWYGAQIARTLREAAGYGFRLDGGMHDWAALVAARERVVARLNEVYAGMLERSGVEVLSGRATLADARHVRIGERSLAAAQVLIATGGQPWRPALPGSERGIDSDGFFRLQERPERVLLIGSGYIAVELAGVLAALGSVVTLVCRDRRLLGRFDELLGESVEEALRDQGVTLVTGAGITGLAGGAGSYELALTDGRQLGKFDEVIWATGRRPNVEDLGLEALGLSPRAGIVTDHREFTGVAGLYAVGDCTGEHLLTPVAIARGRALADRLFGGHAEAQVELDLIPSVIFAHPPLATVGLSEAQARSRYGEAVKVYSSRFAPLYYGPLEHKVQARMKLVCEGAEERVVGLHVAGDGADELLQGFAVALRMGACKRDFDRTIAIHPTVAEELVTLR
ncbi:glutathione-disulfide reductase [Solimonas sp. K1W22B-7]|uniref:glutathione-disulfide reductase n=1 Tax=Solimonas sp. K1W22B-7 TaxID=2303331 RepID=UPI000E335C60|nr:glutathione-disulfide reductase [Solimonas sp. K1W22B-7]AXQ27723.1 glutathione-disulfide reductase [Solimonas sp. K1W22B-7]